MDAAVRVADDPVALQVIWTRLIAIADEAAATLRRTSFSPIVNAPEVAILGVSKSQMKPVWDGKAFVPRLLVPLSLSADHRVIDGAMATRFNAALAQLLGDFRRTLL